MNDSASSVLIFGEQFRGMVKTIEQELENVQKLIRISEKHLERSVSGTIDFENIVDSSPPDEERIDIVEEYLHTLF